MCLLSACLPVCVSGRPGRVGPVSAASVALSLVVFGGASFLVGAVPKTGNETLGIPLPRARLRARFYLGYGAASLFIVISLLSTLRRLVSRAVAAAVSGSLSSTSCRRRSNSLAGWVPFRRMCPTVAVVKDFIEGNMYSISGWMGANSSNESDGCRGEGFHRREHVPPRFWLDG